MLNTRKNKLNTGKNKKYGVDEQPNYNCFMISAQSLSIIWAADPRYWSWPLVKESNDEHVAVAELLEVCWLEVTGRFEVVNLSPGQLYEVVFIVMFKDNAAGWDYPVTLTLTLPDGKRQEHKENFKKKQRGRWIEIRAGEYRSPVRQSGEMVFALNGCEGGTWKRGLLIKGVKIQPKA